MKLLVLTSSWPRFDGDYAGHFVREWVEAVGFPATVLVPEAGRKDAPHAPVSSPAPASAPAPAPAPAEDFSAKAQRSKDARNETSSLGASAPLRQIPAPAIPRIEIVRVPYARDPRLFYGGGVLANLRRNPFAATQIPRAFHALFDAARTHARNADVVVSHWLLPAGVVGAAIARLARRPHVAVSHGSDRWLVDAIPFLGPRILARAAHIPMGVPVAAPSPPASTFSRVAFVGRLEREKGLDVLGRAMDHLPWLKVTVAGRGSVRPPARAHCLGAVPTHEVARVLAAHDGCVLPSRREGAPRVLLEAMMVGRPIVASNVGRIPDIARDGHEALLVPPDSPRALANALTRLRDDSALRSRLSAAAHRRALDFAWPRIAAAYRRIILDAVL
ncbi:MAG: glycosyltransferase family 4 protein [Deltaproteobacteria bacterium]|nr:glycosyltransferase family 4 protein [Deltaproteobacteria bacterium]